MWTYQVVKESISYEVAGKTMTCERYGVCEVHDGGGYSPPVTVEAVVDGPDDEDPIASLRWKLTEMLKALDKPVHQGVPVTRALPARGALDSLRVIMKENPAAGDDDIIRWEDGLSFGHLREMVAALADAPPKETPARTPENA